MARKIRILHVLGDFSVGGIQSVIRDLIVNSDPQKFKYDICEMTDVPGNLVENIQKHDVNVFQCSLRKGVFSFGNRFKELLRNGNYDGVHVSRESVSWIVLKYAYQMNVPVRIVHFHSSAIIQLFSRNYFMNKLSRFYIPRYANAVVGCSRNSLEHNIDTGKIGNCKSAVIYNSVDRNKYLCPDRVIIGKIKDEFNLSDDNIVIGTCSRINHIKRPVEFVKVAREVCEQLPNAVFIWVGDGDAKLKDEMLKLVSEYDLHDKIKITGYRHDVPELLNVFDIYIQLSKWEGFPVAPLEAQVAGKPVIVSEAGGFDECLDVEMLRWRAAGDDIKAFANNIIKLARQPELRNELGQRGFEHSKKFELHQFVQNFEKLYCSLINDIKYDS